MAEMCLIPEVINGIDTPLMTPANDDLHSDTTLLSVNMHKTTTLVEDCYDSLGNFGCENLTPFSKINEFKIYGGYFLEDLDTNVDTTSIPESEVVSEYFDIYSTNESLDKICSLDSVSQKWDFINYSPSATDQTTKSDETSIVEIFNESNESSNTEHDLTPFFEDEFRYVTCRWKGISKSSNTICPEMQANNIKKDCVGCNDSIDIRNKRNYESVDFQNSNFYEKRIHQLQAPNDTKGYKQLVLENNSLVTVSVSLLENSLHFIPTLSHKCAKLVSPHPINTNYCVYVGADYNKLVCSCDMIHHKGSNSHSTNCKVVLGGIELSTESWPVSRASKLYPSVNNWDRRLNKYHKSINTILRDNFSTCNPKDTNFCLLYQHKPDGNKAQQRVESCSCTLPSDSEPLSIRDIHIDKFKDELLKIENILISEITGVKVRDGPKANQEKEKVPEVLQSIENPNDTGKRRRLYKHKAIVNLSETNKLVSDNSLENKTADAPSNNGSESGNEVSDHRSRTCKHDINHNNEKVSGVWYDTNRHLWRVVYMKGNKRKTQGFSTLKLGYEEARRKAIQLRHEMVALYQNDKF